MIQRGLSVKVGKPAVAWAISKSRFAADEQQVLYGTVYKGNQSRPRCINPNAFPWPPNGPASETTPSATAEY